MTEAEWLNATDPDRLQAFLRANREVSSRKLRLFGCACCRRIWHLMTDERSRVAVEVVERYADGGRTQMQLSAAQGGAARAAGNWNWRHAGRLTVEQNKLASAAATAWHAARPTEWIRTLADAVRQAAHTAWSAERLGEVFSPETGLFQCQVIRCVFGNPFRPSAVDPSWQAWNGGTLVRLAEAAYEDRELPSGHLDNGRLALVADALEDAGCADAGLLGHLRSAGPHVLGCWAVDLLTGK